MCDEAVSYDPSSLQYVPHYFVMQQQVKTWYNYNGYCNANELIKWYNDYQKWKAQKAKIKKELMPIAWHPSSWWEWCVPQDEKQETEKLLVLTGTFLHLMTGNKNFMSIKFNPCLGTNI